METTINQPLSEDKEIRMKYIHGEIKELARSSEEYITPPAHWVDPNIFSPEPQLSIKKNF